MNRNDTITTDAALWQRATCDDTSAFETLVRRHQSAVCAVAYCTCGNLALSEDIAQETFWAAWRNRQSLLNPSRLRAWLCGIARNLARNRLRSHSHKTASLDTVPEPVEPRQEPAETVISREEEHLVWEALEQIPETYREPLVLFYREHQSVTDVASCLELTEDAVKQRLSRGRNLLREQVAELIEGTLRKSAPRGRFAVAVMAGLVSATGATKTALAGTATAAAGMSKPMLLASAGAGGVTGGLVGIAGGLFGGWLGMWVPAQLAPTRKEHDVQMAAGRRMLIAAAVFSAVMLVMLYWILRNPLPMWATVALLIGWIIGLNLYITIETITLIVVLKKIRREASPELDPNPTWLKSRVQQSLVQPYAGRVYQSRTRFLGLPLIDIQVSDPGLDQRSQKAEPKRARGWIAIGDRADGVLLAIGGIARGGIAIGGMSVGVIAAGGGAFGLISLGGLAIGLIAFGGFGLGGIAVGGLAIGWQAAGGCAIAWDVATGGCAIARHAASGGAAYARDLATGGAAVATHANDDLARRTLQEYTIIRGMDWFAKHAVIMQFVIMAVSLLPAVIMQPLMYTRRVASVGPDRSSQDQ